MAYDSDVVQNHEDCVMTVEEFKRAVATGLFIDSDGIGIAAKLRVDPRKYVSPSTVNEIPDDATHIVWFNK